MELWTVPHRRDRVHPGHSKYYRGDKHFHFITSQVIVSVSGFYAHLALANGHNNDQVLSRFYQSLQENLFEEQGVFNMTMRDGLSSDTILLVDDGYNNGNNTVRADYFDDATPPGATKKIKIHSRNFYWLCQIVQCPYPTKQVDPGNPGSYHTFGL